MANTEKGGRNEDFVEKFPRNPIQETSNPSISSSLFTLLLNTKCYGALVKVLLPVQTQSYVLQALHPWFPIHLAFRMIPHVKSLGRSIATSIVLSVGLWIISYCGVALKPTDERRDIARYETPTPLLCVWRIVSDSIIGHQVWKCFIN